MQPRHRPRHRPGWRGRRPQPTPQRLAGARGRNPGLGHPVISGPRPGGGWHTGGYTTARFGNPYPGTRLLLDMGRTVAVISMHINLGKVPGTGFRPRAGTKPALANTPSIAQAAGGKDVTAGTVTIELRRVR